MALMKAMDTFNTTMPDGTERTVRVGEPFPENHVLVQRDIEAAQAAIREKRDRVRQFAPFDLDEEQSEPKPAAKPLPSRRPGRG